MRNPDQEPLRTHEVQMSDLSLVCAAAGLLLDELETCTLDPHGLAQVAKAKAFMRQAGIHFPGDPYGDLYGEQEAR